MKKVVTLFSILLFAVSACKKDKKQAKPIDQALISTTWITTLDKREYFNETGSKLSEQNMPEGTRFKFKADTKTVTITDLNGGNTQKSYSIETSNGKHFITVDTEKYEITAYTDKTMSWRQEKTNQTYEEGKVAARQVVSIDFHCPCRD